MQIKIPESAKKYIALQRTGYKNLEDEFNYHINKEFEEMKPFLPNKAENIIDIGCGMCGIDVLIYHHFNDPDFLLIDGNDLDEKIFYGYKKETSIYNSFIEAEDLLIKNEVPSDAFSFCYALDFYDIPIKLTYDLIISLLSCGYHYPLETYLPFIVNNLSNDGVFICDIRQGTNGLETIKQNFLEYKIISDYNKSDRIAAYKPIRSR